MSDVYTLKLPAHIAEVLLWVAANTEQQEVVTVSYLSMATFTTGIAYELMAGDARQSFTNLKEDVIAALVLLGMIQMGLNSADESGVFFLTQKGQDWAEHHRSGWFGRWWERSVQWGKQAAPLIVSAAAVILTILQILQALGVLRP